MIDHLAYAFRLDEALEQQKRKTKTKTRKQAGIEALQQLYSLIGDSQDRQKSSSTDDSGANQEGPAPPATVPELCGELAGLLGLLQPSQWVVQCQLKGLMAVAYTAHGSVEWLEEAAQLLREAEEVCLVWWRCARLLAGALLLCHTAVPRCCATLL